MKQTISKFLEFNGKTLLFLSVDGTYWVAIKPILEALEVDYIRHFRNLKEDYILGASLSKQTMMVPGDSQPRKFICIPEMYVYGWIFSIKSASQSLAEYKKECYEVLYNHFHGSITGRRDLLLNKTKIANERHAIESELRKNELYQQLESLRAEEMRIGKALFQNDREFVSEQLRLF